MEKSLTLEDIDKRIQLMQQMRLTHDRKNGTFEGVVHFEGKSGAQNAFRYVLKNGVLIEANCEGRMFPGCSKQEKSEKLAVYFSRPEWPYLPGAAAISEEGKKALDEPFAYVEIASFKENGHGFKGVTYRKNGREEIAFELCALPRGAFEIRAYALDTQFVLEDEMELARAREHFARNTVYRNIFAP